MDLKIIQAENKMNKWGKERKPFNFLIDYESRNPLIFPEEDSAQYILWATPEKKNYAEIDKYIPEIEWNIIPVDYSTYQKGFNLIRKHTQKGDTFLLNYTQPTKIYTNLNLQEIFHIAKSPYKIYLKNSFACFSPEPFVRIKDNRIYSFPMKGTIDASLKDAVDLIMKNPKETAEHHTIVDLIRNDLSRVAYDVSVKRFRYIEEITTNQKKLLQVSTEIQGELPDNYHQNIGSIIFKLLPAGSISGAPKPKTVEIIRNAENYSRGYYTGIFGYFDGQNLDSCVLIRFIENNNGQLIYKSGGGITFLSDCKSEYHEMINKVYVPFA